MLQPAFPLKECITAGILPIEGYATVVIYSETRFEHKEIKNYAGKRTAQCCYVEAPPALKPWGEYDFTIHDPDGHCLEFDSPHHQLSSWGNQPD